MFNRKSLLLALSIVVTTTLGFANESRDKNIERQNRTLGRFSRGAAPSREGLPSPGDLPDPTENLENAYTTTTLIELAIDQAQVLSLGDRIRHYEKMAEQIVAKSAQRSNEETVRMTLNRAVDVVNSILNVMGQNPSLIAQWTANFYEENFKLAKMFANNPSTLMQKGSLNSSFTYHVISIAEFGRIYSTLLWRFSTSLTSATSKAIMLMKLVGFLTYDVNLDLARDNESLKEVLADLVHLQEQNANYQKILDQLDANTEPTTVNLLRSDVYYILQKLPARLQKAGIASLGPK